MSVWTRQQIRQARGIRARAHVDDTMVERARVDVMAATREKMFKQMAHIGHSFAIELNPADVQFREVEDDEHPFCTKVSAWWEPEVQEVEFRGGPRDGQRMAVQRPGEPIRAYEAEPIDWANVPTEPAAITNNVLIYDVAGWHEQGRYWIYEKV